MLGTILIVKSMDVFFLSQQLRTLHGFQFYVSQVTRNKFSGMRIIEGEESSFWCCTLCSPVMDL